MRYLMASLFLAACATQSVPRPISYPWSCEVTRVQPCTRLGYEVQTAEPVEVMSEAGNLCPNGAKSMTMDPRRNRSLVVCE